MNNKNKTLIIILTAAFLFVGIVVFLMTNKPMPINKSTVKVYFSMVVGAKTQTEPVTRKLPKGEDPLSLALSELLQGPTEAEKDKGFYSEIPIGTRVINIKEASDAIRINLNEQFISGGGSNSVVLRLKELTNTALDAEPIRKIYLDIDGNQLDAIGGEGLEVVQPLVKDNVLIESKNK